MLLGKGADPNLPLYWASWKGYNEIVGMLLEKGADPNLADKDGRTPLLLASKYGYKEVIEMLLCSGANAQTALAILREKNLKGEGIEMMEQWPIVPPLVILCQRAIAMKRVDTEGIPEMFLVPPDPNQIIAIEAARRGNDTF